MTALLILVMACLSATIFIMVLLYVKKTNTEKEMFLDALWNLKNEESTQDDHEYPVERLKVLTRCRFDRDRFLITMSNLKRDGIVDYDHYVVWFTKYGYEFYMFDIKSYKRVVG